MAVAIRGFALLGVLLLAAGCEAAPSEPDERTVMGLPVVTVAEALEERSGLSEADPIAVSGWYSTGPWHSCPAPADAREENPLAMECERGESVIAERAESGVVVQRTVAGDSTSISIVVHEPDGPYLFPLRDGPVNGDPFGGRDPWIPVPVIAVGHFNDHRAAGCKPADVDFCAGVFVIDLLVEADGNELGAAVQGDPGLGPASHSVDEVVDLIDSEFGEGAEVLWLQALRGQDLAAYEDRAAAMPALAVGWLAEIVDTGPGGNGAPRLLTILIADDSGDVIWTSAD